MKYSTEHFLTLLLLTMVAWPRASTAQTATADAVLAWGYSFADMPVAAQSGVTAITAGYWHSMALKSDGSVVAWGHNGYGQVTGTPPIDPYSNSAIASPVTLGGQVLGGVTAIAAGYWHSVALKNDGTVVAWGSNGSGQQANVPASAQSGVTAIAVGDLYTVVLKVDGSVVAWGHNYYGQVTGTPTTDQPYFAVASPVTLGGKVLSGVTAIAAGGSHTVALKNDGTVVSWGWNGSGETNVPAGLSGVVAVAAGWRHTVALRNDGSVVAWGHNSYGQTTVPSAAQSGVAAIAAGYELTVALKTNGTVVAWGNNGSGQVTGTPTPAEPYSATATPVALGGQVLSGVRAIAAGQSQTLALVVPTAPTITTPPMSQTVSQWRSASLTVTAAGYALNYQWRLDDTDLAGATNATYSLVFAQTNQAGSYTVVVSNRLGSVTSAPPALLTVNPSPPGSVVAWGNNNSGQTTVPVAAQSGVTAIAAGGYHTVALKNDGAVVAWGANDHGQTTGTPTTNDYYFAIANPVTLGGDVLSGVMAIAAGEGYTAALKHDGSVVAWGMNLYGEVTGTLTPDDPYSAIANPVILEGQVLGGVTAIAAGNFHTVALRHDGSVVAWGWNVSGQTDVPAGLSGVMAVAAGAAHSVALRNDGTVVAWGQNDSGQTNVPAGLSGVIAVAAGGFHTVALKNDGSIVAWGGNYYGEVAGTPTIDLPSAIANPVILEGQVLRGVTAIAAGYRHTVALKNDGSVVAWGLNYIGQVTGTPTPDAPSPAIASPVTLGGQALSGVTAITAGGASKFGILGQSFAILGTAPLLPSLNARPNGKELVLSWSTNTLGFTLQSTTDLTPPVTWFDSARSEALIGTHFTITNAASGRAQFYRLRKPD